MNLRLQLKSPDASERIALNINIHVVFLCYSLVQSSINLPVPRALVTQIYQHSLEVIANHLQSCQWKMKIDVGSMKSMLSIVNSLVGTKPACHLSESDKHYISVLIIKVPFSFYFLLYYID